MADAFAITDRICGKHRGQPTTLVGIDGPGGAGKTTFAASLTKELRRRRSPTQIIHMDDFFLPSQERPRGTVQRRPIGGDFDWERLRDQVLLLLRHGEPARFQCYDWKRNCLAEWYNVSKGGVIIVEGIYSTRQELRGFYDLRVWIECPRRVRLARGIERDGEQARTQWETEWMPSEDRYMTAHQPAAYADFVVKTLTPQPSRELLRND